MDVREKLVELLDGVQHYGTICTMSQMDDRYASITQVSNTEVAERLIANGVTVQEWISVKDRLPDDNERVIAYRPNEPETSAYKYCVMWGWSVKTSLKHRGITHWCAMPQPTKGE